MIAINKILGGWGCFFNFLSDYLTEFLHSILYQLNTKKKISQFGNHFKSLSQIITLNIAKSLLRIETDLKVIEQCN